MRCACFIAAFALVSSIAQGQEVAAPVAQLRYDAPPSCPDRASFRDLVLARLGYSAFRDEAPREVHVSLEVREGGFAGRVTLEGTERLLSAARCEDLADAAAVVVALAVDPLGEGAAETAEAERQPLSPELEALSHEAPAPAAPTEPQAATEERATLPPLLHVSGGVLLGVGRLSRASLGGALRVAIGRGLFSLRLEGTFESALGPDQSAELSLRTRVGTAGAALCMRWRFLQACAGGRYGALAARLRSEAQRTETQRVAVGYVGAELSAGLTRRGVDMRIGVGADAPIRRPEVRSDGDTLWRASPVLLTVHATVGFSVLR